MIPLFSPAPILLNNGIAIIRIVVGLLLIYHGIEIFTPETMNSYLQWDMFKGPYGKFMVYAGKTTEFIAGVFCFLLDCLQESVPSCIDRQLFLYYFFCWARAFLVRRPAPFYVRAFWNSISLYRPGSVERG